MKNAKMPTVPAVQRLSQRLLIYPLQSGSTWANLIIAITNTVLFSFLLHSLTDTESYYAVLALAGTHYVHQAGLKLRKPAHGGTRL